MNNINEVTDVPQESFSYVPSLTAFNYIHPNNKDEIFRLVLAYYCDQVRFNSANSRGHVQGYDFNLVEFEIFYKEFKRIYNEV